MLIAGGVLAACVVGVDCLPVCVADTTAFSDCRNCCEWSFRAIARNSLVAGESLARASRHLNRSQMTRGNFPVTPQNHYKYE